MILEILALCVLAPIAVTLGCVISIYLIDFVTRH